MRVYISGIRRYKYPGYEGINIRGTFNLLHTIFIDYPGICVDTITAYGVCNRGTKVLVSGGTRILVSGGTRVLVSGGTRILVSGVRRY